MFDSVLVDCPNCGASEALEFQSKSGPCALHKYRLSNVPDEVLTGVYNDIASRCEECGKVYYPKVVRRPIIVRHTLSLLEHPDCGGDECEGVDTRTDVDKALDEGIARVYQRYGTDLRAFFRDGYKQGVKKQP
jgi:uncharacterized Zn finger protein